MTLHALTLIVGWMAVELTAPAAAAEIYRCGPNGSTYSQTPCADGRRVELVDARGDEQRLQAKRVTERTVAMASSLERDRLASEAALRPALAGSFDAPAKKVSSSATRSNAPSSVKAKKKRLRVAAEAANRRMPKSAQDVVLAQPRN